VFTSQALNDILHQELEAGNSIQSQGPGFGKVVLMALMSKPFHKRYSIEGSGLVYNEVNDPHYWKDEYEDPKTQEVIAGPYF
jgi:hypothetical protein